MKWPCIRLGDVCDVISGATPKTGTPAYWDGDIPWATPKDLSDNDAKYLHDTPRKITVEGFKSCSLKMLPPGSILLSSRAPIGLVAINQIPVCTNQGFKNLVPIRNAVSSEYLYWWLRCNRSRVEHAGRGATFKEVSKAIVESLEIPLPPLAEQQRIAGILDAADALRATRREALAQLDTLLQATFLDMFGDPVTNPMGWEVRTLDTVGQVQTGSTPPSKLDGMFDGEIPFVTPGDLCDTWVESVRKVTKEGAQKSRTVSRGATFVCCIGATIGKMGKSAEFSAFNQQINAVTWGRDIECNFGLESMRFFKARIARDGASTTLPILKKSLFQKIAIPVPPIDLQHRFAAVVESVEQQKTRMRGHLAELDALFACLQSRAFNGEL